MKMLSVCGAGRSDWVLMRACRWSSLDAVVVCALSIHRVAQLTILMYVLRGGDDDGGRDGDSDDEAFDRPHTHTHRALAEIWLEL